MTKLDTTLLTNALETLKDGYNLCLQNKDEKLKTALQDSCIKRFEYTYETVKKMMNKYLKYEFDKTDLPINNVFREIYGLGLIQDFERWTKYRTMRNDTLNEYNINKAHEIIAVLDDFIKDADFFLVSLNISLNN